MKQNLQEAILSIKNGDTVQGRKLLILVLESDNENEIAWLWMTKCLSDTEQKKECFRRVLEINPNNKNAQEGLRRLETLSQIQKNKPATKPIPANVPKKSIVTPKSIFVIMLTITALCLICLVGVTSLNQEEDTEITASKIYVMCKPYVENSLISPSTAEFPEYYKVDIGTLRGTSNTYVVNGYVDAQNSFGAKIRTHYSCAIKHKGGEWANRNNWSLIELDFAE